MPTECAWCVLVRIPNWSEPRKDSILWRQNSNYCIIAIFNWAEDKVTSSPQKMEMEANCLGHESPKVAILSTQNNHFEKCSFETIYSVPIECA